MRSLTDLDAAFALIEASVDEYSEREPEPARVVELLPDRPRPTPRRRTSRRVLPVLAGAALAASVVALLVAVVATGTSGPKQTPAAKGRPAALGSDGRNLPFTIEQSTGLQVLSVDSTATGRTVELGSRSVHLQVWIGEPDRHLRISSGLEAVTIGDRRGYYEDGYESALDSTSTSPTAPLAFAPVMLGASGTPAVVWEYAPSAFAVVIGFDSESPSKAVLLEAARGIHLTGSVPLSLPFRLAPDPALGSLTGILTAPRLTNDDAPPYGFVSGGTTCTVDYDLAGSGNGIQVSVYSSYPDRSGGPGVAVTVDGHEAHWDAGGHQLVVDLGNDAYVEISEARFTKGYTLGLRQFEHLFGLLTLASDVADPATWFSAQQGLP